MSARLDISGLEALGSFVRTSADPSEAPDGLRSAGLFDEGGLTNEASIWGSIIAAPDLDGEVLRLLPERVDRFRLWCGPSGYVMAGAGGAAGQVGSGPFGLLLTEIALIISPVLQYGREDVGSASQLSIDLAQLMVDGPESRQFAQDPLLGLTAVRPMDRSGGIVLLSTSSGLRVGEPMSAGPTTISPVTTLSAWGMITKVVTKMCQPGNSPGGFSR